MANRAQPVAHPTDFHRWGHRPVVWI